MFSTDPEKKGDVRHEATPLCTQLDKLETVIMANVWDSILTRFKTTTETLQKHDITLDTAECLLELLHMLMWHRRGNSLRSTKMQLEMLKELVAYMKRRPKVSKNENVFQMSQKKTMPYLACMATDDSRWKPTMSS